MNAISRPTETQRTKDQQVDTSHTPVQHPLVHHLAYAGSDSNGNHGATREELMAGWSLIQMYGRHAFDSEDDMDTMPRVTLPERLSETLLELGYGQNGRIQGVSLQAIADHLGTSRETIGAILRAFRRQGMIDLGYRYIQLLDVGSLKELGGTPAYV